MTEPVQILIFAVVVLLTSVMVIIGWQIYLILSEIRKSLIKTNIMLDKAVAFTDNVQRDVNTFSEGIKAVLSIVRIFINRKEKHKNGDERK